MPGTGRNPTAEGDVVGALRREWVAFCSVAWWRAECQTF